MQRLRMLCVVAGALALLVPSSASSSGSSARRVGGFTVTVVVVGKGKVTSSPRGLACPRACRVRFAWGTHLVLAAHDLAGSTFDHWAGGCSGSASCALRVTRARTVVAVFTSPRPPPPPPAATTTTTTPAPPPPAVPGHYTGTTSGGNHVQIDVSSDGQTITRAFFDSVNGSCNLDYGVILPDGLTLSYGIPVDPDGTFGSTFQGSGTENDQPESENGTLQGRFTGGTATGSVTLDSDFFTQDGTHLTCSASETWTASLTP
jgi:hypothetical protein